MARLPDTDAFSGAAPQPAGGVASFEPPNWRQVGMAGQEISGAGHNLQQASDTIAQTNERQDVLVAQSAANSLKAQSIALQYDPEKGFANVKEGGAVGAQFVDGYTQRLTDAQQAIRGQLTTPNQQRIYDQHAEVAGLQFKQALLEHQARQTELFNDTTDNDTVNLAMRGMAQRPLDELNFQTGMTQIAGTIDQMGARKGLPPQAVAAMKAQYFDAAYGTRILAITNGVPGVVQANPYLAEKMFEQVQDKLGPSSQVTLGHEVLRAVQTVQQRDVAQGIVSGRPPTAPNTIAPALGDAPPLQGVVQDMESKGQRYDASGALLTSPKGAMGEMQVVGPTAADPGFGVRPAALGPDGKPTADELARVGRDYLGAMTARYDNPALVLAAYNAGPGKVDEWLGRFGDPRTGAISAADWAARIPFPETQKYVTTGLQKLAGAPAVAVAPAPKTANELKLQLPALMQQARDVWSQMYPNDPVGADGAATRVASYAQLTIANQTAQQDAARDALTRGLVGAKPDGSARPQTMDALLADPAMKSAWNSATPEVQLEVQARMRNGEPPRTPDTQKMVYQLMGQYSNDRESFANLDLTPLVSRLPYADFDKLTGLQVAARNKQDRDADKAVNIQHAMGVAELMVLKPAGMFVPDKNTPANKRELYDQFTGALVEQLEDFRNKNGKPPADADVIAMSRNLMTTVQQPGRLWGTNDIRAFQVGPANQGSVTVKVPDDFRTGITAALKAKGVGSPSETQIQTAYLASLRTAPKVK
jgi:hypothetical protein